MTDAVQAAETQDVTLSELVAQLAQGRNLDLRGYKHGTLGRRLRKRMAEVGVSNYREYLRRVQADPVEVTALLNTLLINVTEFFRDTQAWEALRLEALPALLQDMQPGSSFRAWCAGCASGEEAYSLAILLAGHFGPRLPDYDIKIYGTDVDEDALNFARHGEYAAERLRRVRPEWREKFFSRYGSVLRVNRDVRRMLIFGRGNLMADAPISHCQLVVCRNVLIYFDTAAQRHIFSRLYYALEPDGVLFLGKAESKLTNSLQFKALNSRWRIFQKIDGAGNTRAAFMTDTLPPPQSQNPAQQQEAERLRHQQRYIMETMNSGIIVLDGADIIANHNETALAIWGLNGVRLAGRRLQNTELLTRCPELGRRLSATRGSDQAVQFECSVRTNGEERTISVTLRPMLGDTGEHTGTLMHCEDVTHHEKLQTTMQQLEATTEELQSSNEELETTNEELQSTNEELETTNEELQSTNEELETTNEELQSLNEELENMNEELEQRTHELHQLTTRYADTLQSMPWPVMLVDREHKIQLWNAVAQKLFGVGATSVVGVDLERLPLQGAVRKELLRRSRQVLAEGKPAILRNRHINGTPEERFDIHFTPITRGGNTVEGVLVMFAGSQLPAQASTRRTEKPRAKAAHNSPPRKNASPAKTKKPQTKKRR